jgi:hypothetical protein
VVFQSTKPPPTISHVLDTMDWNEVLEAFALAPHASARGAILEKLSPTADAAASGGVADKASYLRVLHAQNEGRLAEAHRLLFTPPLPGAAACPQGHALLAFSVPRAGFSCDVCGGAMGRGEAALGCRGCDWDTCLA